MTEALCIIIGGAIFFFLMIIPIVLFIVLVKEDKECKKNTLNIEGARLRRW